MNILSDLDIFSDKSANLMLAEYLESMTINYTYLTFNKAKVGCVFPMVIFVRFSHGAA